MNSVIIEATSPFNYGKFFVGRFTVDEWALRSQVSGRSLLKSLGWSPHHICVIDLQTGEGAFHCPNGLAKADLDKHKIWVCPLHLPFLEWLYEQDLTDIKQLPVRVNLDPERRYAALYGYRRAGLQIIRTDKETGEESEITLEEFQVCVGTLYFEERFRELRETGRLEAPYATFTLRQKPAV